MTIERLENIEVILYGGGSDISRQWITRVQDLIADNRRLRAELNAIQTAAKEAQDGQFKMKPTHTIDKTDMAFSILSYVVALGFLAAHDWKLVAALTFWGIAKLCWADAHDLNDNETRASN